MIHELNELKLIPHSLIFYEAPHRIKDTLSDMLEVFGNRNICLARELTKTFEEYIRGTIEEVLAIDGLKGEMVLIVEGYKDNKALDANPFEKIEELISLGYKPNEAIKELFDTKYDDYPSVNFYRMMLVGGGLRPGECCGICWSDIYGNRLTIKRAINLQGEITKGKNENALRTIILSDIAIQILEKQRQLQERNGIVSKWVFGYDGANQPSLHRLYKRWHGVDRGKGTAHTKGLADLLNCPETSLYSFRHTFVTLCESDGVDLNTLRPLLGHSASMDTFGTYGRVNDALRKRAAQNVDDVFKVLLSS